MTICNGCEYQYLKLSVLKLNNADLIKQCRSHSISLSQIEHVETETMWISYEFVLLTNHPHFRRGDLRKPHKTQYEACNADDDCRLDLEKDKKVS